MSEKVFLRGFQRQLELTLTAFWKSPYRVLPLPDGAFIPVIREGTMYLPEFIEADSFVDAQKSFLRSAFHAIAHLIYSEPQDSSGLNNRQLVLVALIEDARVEYLLSQNFPGIQSLFCGGFYKAPTNQMLFEELAYAVAYSLAFNQEESENPFVLKARRLFLAAIAEDAYDQTAFRAIGLALANDIGQMRISMNERDEFILLNYRDDNSYLWNSYEEVAVEPSQEGEADESVSVTGIGYEEVLDGRAVSEFKENAQAVDGLVFNAVNEEVQSLLLNQATVEQMFYYPEWDYRIARLKQDWCSLNEITFSEDGLTALEERVIRYQHFIKKLQSIILSYQSQMHRRKKQEDGVELDFDAIVDQMVEIKTGGIASESRIYIDHLREHQHELSILVLLDLSESMNDPHSEGAETLLELTLDSTLVLAELLKSLGHSYAIQGFNSNGRSEVSYYNFRDFNDQSDMSYASLGKAEATYSTRLGAALRHAMYKIAKRPERHKLILVITDGQPSDVDVYDEQYLIEDAAVAVKDIESLGCRTFCLSLDKNADDYVQQIFRKGHFEVVPQAEKLPQILTKLYLKVFKSFLA